jgi:large conductance mechanosensitive channel
MATKRSAKSSKKPSAAATKPVAVKKAAVSATTKENTTVARNQHLKGFLDFVREQGVVGLAVGLVLGGAVSVLVKSLIDNVVMPPLGFILGSAEGLKGLSFNMGKTAGGEDAILYYGTFLNDVINFVVIAAVVYAVVHMLGFDKKLDKTKE